MSEEQTPILPPASPEPQPIPPIAESEWHWLERGALTHLPHRTIIRVDDDAKKEKQGNGLPPLEEKTVSIVVQAYRQHIHLPHILTRLLEELEELSMAAELLVIDHGMYFNTLEYLQSLNAQIPVRIVSRKDRPGRAPLLREDIAEARGSYIVIFDADLEYDVGAIPRMIRKLEQYDIVVGEPGRREAGFVGAFHTLLDRFLFAPLHLLLLGVPQAGLRAYRRKAILALDAHPPFHVGRGLDAQLLFHARTLGFVVAREPVERASENLLSGVLHRNLVRLVLAHEIYSIRRILLTRFLFPFLYPPTQHEYTSAGFTNIRDYLFRDQQESAKEHITKETISLGVVLGITFVAGVALASALIGTSPFRVITFLVAFLYLLLIGLKLFATYRAIRHPYPTFRPEELSAIVPEELPVMTVLIPLYKEKEIIPQIFKRISDLDYPTDKLDVIFILESTDQETIDAFLANNPPAHFKALLSPNVLPKTKPKALNVAFQKSIGQIVVIYDAEILPDIDQLKKAYLGLKKYPEAMYLHARMNVYNADYNWITKLYDAEFGFFYDYFLPGIVSMNVPLPISGHSTYFRREVIEKVGGWDPYNVAEDCDIGIRLYRHGFRSGMMFDSFSWEQSTTTFKTWTRQRTRWVQGFIQTSMVHLRYPLLLKQELGSWWNFLWFLMLVPGNVIINILNLIQWSFFLAWVTLKLPFIEYLYPTPTLYMANFTFIVGNFLFTYFNLIGLYSRRHYRNVRNAFFSIFYWLMLGVATLRAAIHFFWHPYSWDKTAHFSQSATMKPVTHGTPA